MTLKSGSLGTLLQGVSQQPEQVRLEGQVTEQVNLISDVTQGLITRPGTEGNNFLSGSEDIDYDFHSLDFDNRTWLFGNGVADSGERVLRCWGPDGRQYAVDASGANANYIGAHMRYHVVNDQVIVCNPNFPVEATGDTPGNPNRSRAIQLTRGKLNTRYRLFIKSGDYSRHVTYTTPSGADSGDAELADPDNIIRELVEGHDRSRTDVRIRFHTDTAVATTTGATVFMELYENTSGGQDDADPVSDAKRYIRDTAVSVASDLPARAANGSVVRVTNGTSGADDYWLKFRTAGVNDPEDGTVVGEGVWRETAHPSQIYRYNSGTMPHVLTLSGNTWTFSRAQWVDRETGDDETNPFTSVKGSRIRDINSMEGRLILLTDETVVMSRTNRPFDLWKESATQTVATDPIDISSTGKDRFSFDWLVPFERDMYVLPDPGNVQYVIRGGGIDPRTVSMLQTSELDVNTRASARPVSTGNSLLLPFLAGRYSGIKSLFIDNETLVNNASSLTEAQNRYLRGRVQNMAVSQSYDMALFRTTLEPKTIYVYKYLWDGTSLVQSAWSKMKFADVVEYFWFDSANIHIVCEDQTSSRKFVQTINLNRENTSGFNFHIRLDRKEVVNVDQVPDGLYFVTPYEFPIGVLREDTGDAPKGTQFRPTSSVQLNGTTWRHFIPTDLGLTSSDTVLAGQEVRWELKPGRVIPKDYQNRPDTQTRLTIQEFELELEASGNVTAEMDSKFGGSIEYTFEVENEQPELVDNGLFTGRAYIPWGERTDYADLTLKGTDARTVNILELAWNGQTLKPKGRRV